MPRMFADLAGRPWRFGAADRRPLTQDDRAAVREWLPAIVPGDARADLAAAGKLPASNDPAALAGSAWVDDHDWWYLAPLESAEPGLTAVLEADGIDYLSAVWLDDHCLAVHEGMFGRQTVVLSPALNAPGGHELAVRIQGGGALRKARPGPLRRAARAFLAATGLGTEYFPDRLNVTKAQFSFGWDFAPRVLTCGIWDDLRIVYARGAYLEDVFAAAQPLDERADPVAVRWRVSLTVRRFDPGHHLAAELVLSSLDGDTPIARSGPVGVTGADGQVLTLDAPPLQRWWPWDQGEPCRYRLTVRLSDERGPCDEKEVLVGVRTVARGRLSTGAPWRFTVNGRHVFLRGANWVPADILPGTLRADDYAKLVSLAADAGINYLRVWGGGLREKAAFYDECDRRGILVSQEFPLACTFLDHYPRDREYLDLLESEAAGIVRALRNHPSLLAWCGGNEISPRRERSPLRILERVLEREDPARPWLPASPSEGDVHNWDVWHGLAPWQDLDEQTPPFMSEFGLQALPSVDSLVTMFDGDIPPSLDDPRWTGRKLQPAKLRHYIGPAYADELYRAVYASQKTQAAVLQTGIEACRLRREGSGGAEPCGGVAFWQFNEPWPAVSWAVVDRAGRPKAAYDMLKASYAPLLVAARFVRNRYQPGDSFEVEVWVVNDTPEAKAIDRVLIVLELEKPDRSQPPRSDERVIFGSGERFEIAEACAIQIDAVTFELDASPQTLRLSCEAAGRVIATNAYDLTVYLPPPQPMTSRLLRRVADWLLGGG